MRVLVTGAGGQLGLDLVDAFASHEVVALGRRDLDVGDEAAVATAVEGITPDLVVNAAAWTDVDGCEADPEGAHRSNALGPWWLARACERRGATLVTLSTDYVFDGIAPLGSDGAPRGFDEWDRTGPIGVYGRSKLAGEQLVRSVLERHHIVRTAWLSGARGRNFVRTIRDAAREGRSLRVVDDQIGSPTTTRDLAAAVRELAVSGRYGTVHLANSGACSWFELATAIVEEARIDVEVEPQSSSALRRAARRPSWSVLDTTHARTMGIAPMPHWRDGLVRLLAELDAPGSAGGARGRG